MVIDVPSENDRILPIGLHGLYKAEVETDLERHILASCEVFDVVIQELDSLVCVVPYHERDNRDPKQIDLQAPTECSILQCPYKD